MSQPAKKRPWPTPTVMVLLLVIYVVAVANWQYPVLRVEPRALNPLILSIVMLIPFAALPRVLGTMADWPKRALGCALLPVVSLSCLVSSWAFLDFFATLGDARNVMRQSALELNGYTVVVYRTDPLGAFGDFHIKLRQERSILPGVLLVRDLYEHGRATQAAVERIGPDMVRVVIPPYRRDEPRPNLVQTFQLQPWVYW